MLRAILATLVLAISVSLPAHGPAHAGIALPCTGEVLVKVQDIRYPAETEDEGVLWLKQQDLNLGYLFKGCVNGAWVGHAGLDKQHVKLSETQLAAMLAAGGIKELPPVPSYWSSPENYRQGVLWIALALLLVTTAVLQQLGLFRPASREAAADAKVSGPSYPALAVIAEDGGVPVPPSFRSAIDAVERAASERSRVVIAGPIRSARAAAPKEPAPSRFGKR